MHVRYGSAQGLSVLEESTGEDLGILSGVVLHPDELKVEGFFVRMQGFFHGEDLFLPSAAIQHWGTRVRVGHAHHIAPISELVRMQSILESGRTILGQKILGEAGEDLGTCRDVQFSTMDFSLEWIFPKKRLRWRRPIPVSAILEVRPDAVVVRDLQAVREGGTVLPVLSPLDPTGQIATS